MTGGRIDGDTIRTDAVRHVAVLMAAAAITAPKSGGQLFLAGKPAFMETVIIDDPATRAELAAWMRARGRERREQIWFRDADVAEAVQTILFVGLAPNWYPPNYDCDACGYATCAEFLHATKALRAQSAELEFTGPGCTLRDIDLGIAVGSAAKTAALHSIDCRCQTRVAVAARKLGHIAAEVAVALSLSVTTKPSASTGACPTLTSTPSTSPPPRHCPSASRELPAAAAPATGSRPATHRQDLGRTRRPDGRTRGVLRVLTTVGLGDRTLVGRTSDQS
jgi:uncharacterized ferredoxin-like protein